LGAFFAASLVVAAGAAESTPQPAMWVVRDADSTIYLLGTFHAVKPGTNWRTEKIDAAFEASDEIWTEVKDMTDAETQRQIEALVLKHGLDPAHPLSSKLSPADADRLKALVKQYGFDAAATEMMRPWLVALTLGMAPAMGDGYEADQGADYVLEADAKAAHKAQKGFETAEQQIMIFADLSPEDELEFLLQSMRSPAESKETVDQLADAWVSGNTEAMDKLMLITMKAEAPGLYDAVFARRNMAWSRQLAAVMEGAGTSFVAVGAGHLVGEDGVPALLADLGFEVERY
jgi:uncharacterized protein YbaP (TraB family)